MTISAPTSPEKRQGLALPTVSVVVPCFNSAGTIAETIASVRAQTFERFEIIIVDDGSHDNSREILHTLAQSDTRIRVIEQVNSGPSRARNRGVELARGRIIAFLDADDIWLPTHLEHHMQALKSDPKLGLSFSPSDLIDEHSLRTGEKTREFTNNIAPEDLLGGNPTSTCSALVFLRQVYEEVGPMRADMDHAEDQEWLFRVALSRYHIRGISERSVLYRTTPTGLSSSAPQMVAGWEKFIEHARELAPDVVNRHISRATAQIHLYHARRIIRLGQAAHLARWHLAAAFDASPSTVMAKPIHFAVLTSAALAPRLAKLAMRIVRGLRHE